MANNLQTQKGMYDIQIAILINSPNFIYQFSCNNNYWMSAKNLNSAQLCALPDALQFQFREEQEMNSQIIITNLVDRMVNFKIKTNKPGLYLVKPMEGQIYNKSNAKITFKRKELTLQNFNLILANPGQNRQKFLIELSSDYEDGVGITQKANQVVYLAVTFNKPKQSSKISEQGSPLKKQKVSKLPQQQESPSQLIAQKKKQLEALILTKQNLLAQRSSSQSKGFTLQDLIYTVIFFFLLGFIIL